MNSLFSLIAATILGLSPVCVAQAADPHGHIIHRDHDGNCIDEDSSDDFDSDDSEDEDCHAWVHDQKEIEPGYDDEDDPTYEVDHDSSWPTKRENFSEMFR